MYIDANIKINSLKIALTLCIIKKMLKLHIYQEMNLDKHGCSLNSFAAIYKALYIAANEFESIRVCPGVHNLLIRENWICHVTSIPFPAGGSNTQLLSDHKEICFCDRFKSARCLWYAEKERNTNTNTSKVIYISCLKNHAYFQKIVHFS